MVGLIRGAGAHRGHHHHPRVVGGRGHLRGGGGHRAGRRHRGGGGPQPGPLGADAGDDPVRCGRALRPPAGRLPGRGAGDRLRRRHRGALPVRHHVPRGRPRGEHRRRAPAGPAAPGRGLVVLGTTGLLLLGQVSDWTTGAPHVAGADTGAVQRGPAGQVGVHHLPVPLRGHGGTADHRRGRRRGAGPSAAGRVRPRTRPSAGGPARCRPVAAESTTLAPRPVARATGPGRRVDR